MQIFAFFEHLQVRHRRSLCCISKSKIAYVYFDAPRIFFQAQGANIILFFCFP